MSQSTHRFVLEMDAQQAKRVAKEFRQSIEAELGGIGSSTGSSPLANVQKSVEQIAKTEMFTDATRRAEQLENVMRRIRDLSAQVQNMDIKFEPNTARWNAQVEEFYKKVEQAMGKAQADLARGRNVIPNVGAVSQEFSRDTIPVEEWSTKGLRTGEEVKRMGNEYNKVFAELSQAQAERIRLEIEGIEEEIRSIDNYMSNTGDVSEVMLNQLEELHNTKERMVREEAEELASYQRAMQEYIANDVRSVPQDGPAATSRLTISNQTVTNMEKLAAFLQQAEGFQKSIAASTEKQSQSISAEISERRQLLEAEYQGRLKILESERETLEVSERIRQEKAQQAANQKISVTNAQTELTVSKTLLEQEEQRTQEIKLQAQELRKLTAEANLGISENNLLNQMVRTEGLSYTADTAMYRAMQAEEQTEKQRERNHLEVEKRMTAITEAESKERVQASIRETIELRTQRNRELTEFREDQERMTAILREEERRRTATHIQELRERNRQTQRSQSQVIGFLRNTAQDLVLGGLGLYGADMVVSQAYNFGKQGAQQLRTMETFANLAEQVGANAASMLSAIESASSGTINEFDAMSYASQLFAQKFASEVDDIEGDMEIVIRGARRFSQVYTDEFGKPLPVQEIFSRLLKYVREGNKELVDQFGISNQAIADALDIPNEGLGSAEGTINRWKGLLLLIEEQLGRLGEATDSAADRFERSEARISDSINRLRQSASEPIAFVVEMAADVTDVITGNTATAEFNRSLDKQLKDLEEMREQVFTIGRKGFGGEYGSEGGLIGNVDLTNQNEQIKEFRKNLEDLSKTKLDDIYLEVKTGKTDIEDAREELDQFSTSASRVAKEFSRASLLAQAGVLSESAYQVAVSELNNILSALKDGNIEYETAEIMINNIHNGLLDTSSVFSFMIPQAWEFAAAMAAGADAWAEGEAQRVAMFDENPELAMNKITGQDRVIANRSQKALAIKREEAEAQRAVGQQWADYRFSRLSPADQLSSLQSQLQQATNNGSPQSLISALQLEVTKLSDSLNAQGLADLDTADEIRQQTQYQQLSLEEQLEYQNQQLQRDDLTETRRAEIEREVVNLSSQLAENRREEQTALSEERSAAFVETTGERIQNFRTYEEQLNYLGSVAMQAQGTPAEEGINTLIQEVLNKQGQLDERRWETLFDNSNFSVQQQMLLEAITNTNDEYDRKLLQERLTDIVEQEDKRIQQEEERASREESSLAESKRSADLAALDDTGQLNYLKNYLKTLDEGTEEYFDTLKDINSLERRLAEEGSREAQSAWDKAAKDMAKSFEEELAKVMNIPGVLSPSQVTEQDMIDSKYGLYQENADEWLRRAKDELVNNVDRPDVDAGQIAEMLGLPGGLPGEVLYGRLEGAWANQSLFANPDNLGLLNTDAIMSRYEDIKKGEIGRQNLENYIAQALQVSAGEASMIAGTQSPLIQQITGGQSGAEMAAQLSSIQKEVMGNLDSSFVDTIASGWQKDIDQNIAKLDPLADAMADRINSRLTEKLGELTGLIDSVTTRVLEMLGEEEGE